MRPIGLMAPVYRLWASLRFRDILHWQEKWADNALHGYRPGRRAEDVWMDLSMTVESALADGSDLVGMSIDWSKCFDRVPQGIAFQLAERQGLHFLSGATAARHVPRAAKKVRHGGSRKNLLPLTASFKVLMNTRSRSVKAGTTTAMPKVCAGGDIDIALRITGRFATVTQQKTERRQNQDLGHHRNCAAISEKPRPERGAT